jgi:hypothetical protein
MTENCESAVLAEKLNSLERKLDERSTAQKEALAVALNSALASSINLERKLDERTVTQKEALVTALAAAKSAIDAALLEKEKSVNAAFAASEKAITKAEDSQKEYNKTIVEMQKDIVSLKESRSQTGGKEQGSDNTWGYIVGVGGLVAAVATVFWRLHT